MIQLAFGLGTDLSKPGTIMDALRWLYSMLDTVVYQLIVLVYQIFFTIADSSILSSQFIKDFYSRVQLIIGVFMIFKLSVSVLQAVINPEILTDKKRGTSQMITRMITMLAMFTAIIPLNIPNAEKDSYNAYLNQHGLLFGTLYSLQARILDGGAIEKLILGSEANTSSKSKDTDDVDSKSGINKKESANIMSLYILKTFVRINFREGVASGDASDENNYMCDVSTIDGGNTDVYTKYLDETGKYSPADILDHINTSCGKWDVINEKRYALAYFPIVSTICGGLILFVLLSFCIDVAIRSVKLAILRLIAPIPIISYIDPKSSENGSFATWVKLLTSTFLNLFIILAIIYFAISIVGKICDPNQDFLDLPISDGLSIVNSLATVFIIIGIFFFAKQAPKFIMDALGIKGGGGLGVGLSGLLGAAGAISGGGGIRGAAAGFMNAASDANEAATQGKQAPSAYSSQRDKLAQMLTGDKNAKGGFFGRTQMALNDYANDAMARRYFGVDRNMVGRARKEMYSLKGLAATAEEKYKRFSTGHMTAAEISEIEADAGFNAYITNLAANGGPDYATQNADGQRYIMQEYLEKDMSNKQTAANKQEAWHKEGQQILEGMNINETVQEKYSSNRRREEGRIGRRSYGQRRANRLYREDEPGYDPPTFRDYGVSHQHRGSPDEPGIGREDRTNI